VPDAPESRRAQFGLFASREMQPAIIDNIFQIMAH
jgi:hypothetical protein